MAPDSDDRVCVGRISGAHGIKGWVRITSYTEEPRSVTAYGPVSDDKGERMFELEFMRMAKTQVIARIPGVTDRTAAEALRGVRLFVPRAALLVRGALPGVRAARLRGPTGSPTPPRRAACWVAGRTSWWNS